MPFSTAACLFLLHLHFGRRACLDHGDSSRQLGQAFLQFVESIIAAGILEHLTNFGNARCQSRRVAAAADKGVLSLSISMRFVSQSMFFH